MLHLEARAYWFPTNLDIDPSSVKHLWITPLYSRIGLRSPSQICAFWHIGDSVDGICWLTRKLHGNGSIYGLHHKYSFHFILCCRNYISTQPQESTRSPTMAPRKRWPPTRNPSSNWLSGSRLSRLLHRISYKTLCQEITSSRARLSTSFHMHLLGYQVAWIPLLSRIIRAEYGFPFSRSRSSISML